MSAIATVLATMGHTVTGSDLRASVVTDRLAARGSRWPSATGPTTWRSAEVVTASLGRRPTTIPSWSRPGAVASPS